MKKPDRAGPGTYEEAAEAAFSSEQLRRAQSPRARPTLQSATRRVVDPPAARDVSPDEHFHRSFLM